jgi:hypothetical protein
LVFHSFKFVFNRVKCERRLQLCSFINLNNHVTVLPAYFFIGPITG